jgi:two-component system, cell cycle response regulator
MSAAPHQVLVVDDDPACLKILRKFLEKDGYRVACAADGREGLDQARKVKPDLIICDWMMPGLDGPQVCQAIKSDPDLKDIFFIFLTAVDKSHIGHGISQGADDFITKPIDPVEVGAKVKAGLRLSSTQKALFQWAHRDGLTGAYNRRYWEAALAEACRGRLAFLMAMLDVDRFKEINDRWGHQEGDAFLRELVDFFSRQLQAGEIMARLGGDEFAVLLFCSLPALRRLRQAAERELTAIFADAPVGLSLGYARFNPQRPASPEALMARADQRLYAEKNRRRQAANSPPGNR